MSVRPCKMCVTDSASVIAKIGKMPVIVPLAPFASAKTNLKSGLAANESFPPLYMKFIVPRIYCIVPSYPPLIDVDVSKTATCLW